VVTSPVGALDVVSEPLSPPQATAVTATAAVAITLNHRRSHNRLQSIPSLSVTRAPTIVA
jgi:hypothetical protein